MEFSYEVLKCSGSKEGVADPWSMFEQEVRRKLEKALKVMEFCGNMAIIPIVVLG